MCASKEISNLTFTTVFIYVKIKKEEVTGVVVLVFNLSVEYKAWEYCHHIPSKFKTGMLII